MSASFATVYRKSGQEMIKANAGQRKLCYAAAGYWEGWYAFGPGGVGIDATPACGPDGWTPVNKSAADIATYLAAHSGDQTSYGI